jgi:hypothetical protein
MTDLPAQLQDFIDGWHATPEGNRRAFLRLKDHLAAKAGVTLQFLVREGVTYSLRAAHAKQRRRPLFVMLDVIEDRPRWLSICFYGDLVSDPQERGDFVPGGLLGEDACCFDINAYAEEDLAYVEQRIDEAHARAAA